MGRALMGGDSALPLETEPYSENCVLSSGEVRTVDLEMDSNDDSGIGVERGCSPTTMAHVCLCLLTSGNPRRSGPLATLGK